MANIAKTYTFVNSQPADATQVNKNFDDIIAGVGDISAAGHALIDDASAAAQRVTLGVPMSLVGSDFTGVIVPNGTETIASSADGAYLVMVQYDGSFNTSAHGFWYVSVTAINSCIMSMGTASNCDCLLSGTDIQIKNTSAGSLQFAWKCIAL